MNIKHSIISNLKALIDGTWSIKKLVDSFEGWDYVKQKGFTESALHDAIKYASTHVPYYDALFAECGFHPNQFTSISDLSKIPVLTKQIIRTQKEKLRSDELYKLSYTERRSGGTTGEPISSLLTKEARAFETFTFLRGLHRMGWKPEMTFLQVFGGNIGIKSKKRLRSQVYDYMMNSQYIHPFDLDDKTIHKYHHLFVKNKNICLIGYPSALNNLVELLKKNAIKASNVKIAITTSEQLIEDWKINIQNYFNCPIRSYYGCGEIGSLGYQYLGENDDYFIPVENALIESDPDSNELIVTQLHNKAQPLLRYKNGDVGLISSDRLKIKELMGRTADFFYRSDGTKVSPIFGTRSIQDSNIPVTKYQYLQYPDSSIEFRYSMDGGQLTKIQKSTITTIVSNVMNEKTAVYFVCSNEFVLSANGKHRICVRVDGKQTQSGKEKAKT